MDSKSAQQLAHSWILAHNNLPSSKSLSGWSYLKSFIDVPKNQAQSSRPPSRMYSRLSDIPAPESEPIAIPLFLSMVSLQTMLSSCCILFHNLPLTS
ncbi:hypothetical protein GEMRC1_003526 [Eukaryota sp. GEM-RC1]